MATNMKQSLSIGLLILVSACSSHADGIELELEVGTEYIGVVVANNSQGSVDVLGAAHLGVPPGLGTVQWEVSSTKGDAFPCVLVDSSLRSTKIGSGKSRSFRIKTSDLEHVYCLNNGVYYVRAYYSGAEGVVYSNRVKWFAK